MQTWNNLVQQLQMEVKTVVCDLWLVTPPTDKLYYYANQW